MLKRARCALPMLLVPAVAHASFSAAPCATFACHFQGVGLLLGVLGGLPLSLVIFAGLHAGFAHPARSRIRQMVLGGVVGLVAYEIAAAAGAYYAIWQHPPGYRGASPWTGFLVAYGLLAVIAALYARSAPRTDSRGS